MTVPATGTAAPDFEILTDAGEPFRLSAQRGGWLALFFYPQDDTEGCTIENIEFSALAPEFAKLGVKLVGISPDSVADHCAFRAKFNLGVPLLSDPDKIAVNAFGLWQEKKLYGRDYIGLVRSSFLIDPNGVIAAQWKVTRIKGHAQKLLDQAKMLVMG